MTGFCKPGGELIEQSIKANAPHLQVEMQKDDHLIVTGLKERMLDVIVKHVDLIASLRRVSKA